MTKMNNFFVDCPKCGIEIEVEQGVERFNCPRCGFGISINNEISEDTSAVTSNREKTPQTIVKNNKALNIIIKIITVILLVGIGFVFGRLSGGSTINPSVQSSSNPKTVYMPFSSKEAYKRSYSEVVEALKNAVFENIMGEPITKKPFLKKVSSGVIKEIKIVKGDKPSNKFEKDDSYRADTAITIKYYAFN